MSTTGTADEPSKVGISIASISAGMHAYRKLLATLLQRKIDGLGRRIDINMLESMGECMGYPMYHAFDGAPPPPRAGAAQASVYPCGPFLCGDGKTAMLELQNEREWQQFCAKVLLQPALAQDPRFAGNAQRTAQREALKALIVEALSTLTAEQVSAPGRRADRQRAVQRPAGLWAHPQLRARCRWPEVETAAVAVPALPPPGSWDDGDPRRDAVPALSQHTAANLTELGVGADELAALRTAKVV